MVFHNWSLREDGMYFPFLLETGHSSEKSYTGRKSTSESTHNSYEQIQLSRQRGLHSWKCPEPKKLSGDSLLHISKTPCALLLQTLQVLAKRCKFKIGMDCLEWQNSYKGGFFFSSQCWAYICLLCSEADVWFLDPSTAVGILTVSQYYLSTGEKIRCPWFKNRFLSPWIGYLRNES